MLREVLVANTGHCCGQVCCYVLLPGLEFPVNSQGRLVSRATVACCLLPSPLVDRNGTNRGKCLCLQTHQVSLTPVKTAFEWGCCCCQAGIYVLGGKGGEAHRGHFLVFCTGCWTLWVFPSGCQHAEPPLLGSASYHLAK